MNKQRKQKIVNVKKEIEICKDKLQVLLDEERDYFDDMPENLQGSLKGSNSEDAIDAMERCIEELEEITKELIGI